MPIECAPQLKNAIDEYLRYDRVPLLQSIDAEITRLNGESGFSLFKRDASFKKTCLQKLRDKINEADEFATGKHLVELYQAWQLETSTVTYGEVQITRSHSALMALPRNRFKAFFEMAEDTNSAKFLKNTFGS